MRGLLDGDPFDELCRSVKEQGIICPILVEENGDRYNLIAGHRRISAAERCLLGTIPAQIVPADEKMGCGGALAENIVRQDVTAIEEAAAMSDAINQGGYTPERLAKVCGRSVQWVQSRLEILQWPGDVQELIHNRALSVAAARNLALIDDPTQRAMLCSYAVNDGASARTTAAWLQAYKTQLKPVDPQNVETEVPRDTLPAIEPYTPCVICSEKIRVIELRHLPVCSNCQPYLIQLASSLRDAPGTQTA